MVVAWLYLAYTGGVGILVSNTLGSLCEKHSLLKAAKHEWDTKSEHEKRISTAEMNGGSLCLSGPQDHERVDGIDSMH